MVCTDFQRADSLQEAFLKGSPYAHHLAGGLHLGAQVVVGIGKFVKGEPGHFGDHIVQGWLEGCGGIGQRNFLQVHAHADFCRHPGDGIAAGLGSQGGGTGDPGVHLNEVVLEGFGVQGKLDIAASGDFQGTDDFQCAVAEHLVFLVGEGLGGTHHDGVAGVDTHRVQIFHITDGDGGVVMVPHHLVLNFLEAPDAFLHQHLMHRRQLQGGLHQLFQLLGVVGKAAAGSPQGKGRTEHHRIADFLCRLQSLLHRGGNPGGKHRLSQALAQLLEQLSVLCPGNGVPAGAQQLCPALPQHSFFLQGHGQVQSGLAADAGDDGIRPLVADDFRQVFQGQGLHIHLVRHGGVGHNGGRVGIAQHHLVALLLQSKAGLGSGVVKLRCLTNDNGAGADDQYLFQIRSLRHASTPP